jgi:hypothetical protein
LDVEGEASPVSRNRSLKKFFSIGTGESDTGGVSVTDAGAVAGAVGSGVAAGECEGAGDPGRENDGVSETVADTVGVPVTVGVCLTVANGEFVIDGFAEPVGVSDGEFVIDAVGESVTDGVPVTVTGVVPVCAGVSDAIGECVAVRGGWHMLARVYSRLRQVLSRQASAFADVSGSKISPFKRKTPNAAFRWGVTITSVNW